MLAIMTLLDWLRPAPPLDAATQRLVARTVAAVDPLIGQVGGHERKLAPAVRQAFDYCAGIAELIPGPIEISRGAFATDPLVHALFGSADAIETMLATSQCVREHLPAMTLDGGRCCALLGMRPHEKHGFGTALAGEIVRTDVPQKTLYFTDHTLAEPSPDADTARARLGEVLFDGLLKGFASHVADVRATHADLHKEEAVARAKARAAGDPETHTRRLEKLRAELSATADALRPERLLDTLVKALSDPAPYLRLEPMRIAVDRTGVITEAATAGDSDVLEFAVLSGRDQRRWVVILALINRDDARQALERFESARRYIVI